MSNKEYLTISDFAKLAGVSRQTVYNKLDKLDKYVKVIKNVRMISIKAIEDFNCQDTVKDIVKDTVKLSNEDVNQVDKLIDNLIAQIVEKDKQLAEKDRQIEALNKMNDQAQALQLRLMEQQTLLMKPKEPEAVNVEVTEEPIQAEPIPEKPKKRWLWSR